MQPMMAIKNALQEGRPIPTHPKALYRGLTVRAAANAARARTASSSSSALSACARSRLRDSRATRLSRRAHACASRLCWQQRSAQMQLCNTASSPCSSSNCMCARCAAQRHEHGAHHGVAVRHQPPGAAAAAQGREQRRAAHGAAELWRGGGGRRHVRLDRVPHRAHHHPPAGPQCGLEVPSALPLRTHAGTFLTCGWSARSTPRVRVQKSGRTLSGEIKHFFTTYKIPSIYRGLVSPRCGSASLMIIPDGAEGGEGGGGGRRRWPAAGQRFSAGCRHATQRALPPQRHGGSTWKGGGEDCTAGCARREAHSARRCPVLFAQACTVGREGLYAAGYLGLFPIFQSALLGQVRGARRAPSSLKCRTQEVPGGGAAIPGGPPGRRSSGSNMRLPCHGTATCA